MTDSGWAIVAEYGTLYEAELARGRLESAGVPARIDQRDAVGIFGPGHAGTSVRGVALLVPAEGLEAARRALDLQDFP